MKSFSRDLGIPVYHRTNLPSLLDHEGNFNGCPTLRVVQRDGQYQFITASCGNVGTLRVSLSPNLRFVNVKIETGRNLTLLQGADRLLDRYFELLGNKTGIDFGTSSCQIDVRNCPVDILEHIVITQNPDNTFTASLLGIPIARGTYNHRGAANVESWFMDSTPETRIAVIITPVTDTYVFDVIKKIAESSYYDINKHVNIAAYKPLFDYDGIEFDWHRNVTDLTNQYFIKNMAYATIADKLVSFVYQPAVKCNTKYAIVHFDGYGPHVVKVCGNWLVMDGDVIKPGRNDYVFNGVRDLITCSWLKG